MGTSLDVQGYNFSTSIVIGIILISKVKTSSRLIGIYVIYILSKTMVNYDLV